MNCKPGDLAFVVREDKGCEQNIGLIVKVLDRELCDGDEWRVVCEYSQMVAYWAHTNKATPGRVGEEIWIPDSYLRPIRPGDISDEEVRDLYLPKVPEAA